MSSPTSPPSDSDELIQAAEIFVRASDKARYDRVVRGLLEEKLTALLVSDCDALLDHYGRMLADGLRKIGGLSVEVYFPNSTEAVLARFNRILADLTVAEAIQTEGSTAPNRLLLVYDGKATGVKEIQLLARLLKDFPGANTRVVLLLHHTGEESDKKVEAFGKRALRWDIERPSSEEARLLLEQAKIQGMAPEVQALLDATGVQGFEAALALRTGLRALAMADEALGEAPESAAEKKSASKKPLAAVAAGFGAAMERAAASQSKQDGREPKMSGDGFSLGAQEGSQSATGSVAAGRLSDSTPAKKGLPGILVVGFAALAASAGITLWQHAPWSGSEPTSMPSAPVAVLSPQDSAASADTKAQPDKDDTPADLDKKAESLKEEATKNEPAAVGKRDDTKSRVIGPVPERLTEPELKQQAILSEREKAAAAKEKAAQEKAAKGKAERADKSAAEKGTKGTTAASSPTTPASPNPELVRNPFAQPIPGQAEVISLAPAKSAADAKDKKDGKDKKDAKAVASKATPAKSDNKGDAKAGGPMTDLLRVAPGFYVQHASRETRGALAAYYASNANLARARALKLKRIGAPGDNWILVSGPFATIDEAKAFATRPGMPADHWVRPASALRNLLPE